MNIAIVAHNRKKSLLAAFLSENEGVLAHARLVATAGTRAEILRLSPRLCVSAVLSGPLGGDAQIAAMVATGHLDMVIFFRDPLHSHPHDVDVQMLMRLCDVHNVALATNPATAALLMSAHASSGAGPVSVRSRSAA